MSVSIPADDLLPTLFCQLAPWARQVVEVGVEVALSQGRPLYLVGGAVRDLLLGRPGLDLDLMVESPGEGITPADDPLLVEMVSRLEAQLLTHDRFGTATLSLPGGKAVDVVRARTEVYDQPAALPRVKMGSITQDLARRDFSIGAMALRLTPGQSPPLLDTHGGVSDLQQGQVRVLHPHSFEDDPTRLFRAVRFAARFGFRVESATRMWMELAFQQDLPRLLSPRRLATELRKMAEEESFPLALALLEQVGGLSGLCLGPGVGHLPWLGASYWSWRRGEFSVPHLPVVEDPFLVVALGLLDGMSGEQQQTALGRWDLPGAQGLQLSKDLKHIHEILGLLHFGAPRSQVVGEGDKLSPPGWIHLALRVRATHLWAGFQHLVEDHHLRSPLTGHDLLALGVKGGPQMARLLKMLRAGLIDQEISSREQAVARVRWSLETMP